MLYQKLAQKIEELYLLGMSLRTIAKSLKVNRKTVLRALKLKNRLKTQPGRQKLSGLLASEKPYTQKKDTSGRRSKSSMKPTKLFW